jgi:hypothetical protein
MSLFIAGIILIGIIFVSCQSNGNIKKVSNSSPKFADKKYVDLEKLYSLDVTQISMFSKESSPDSVNVLCFLFFPLFPEPVEKHGRSLIKSDDNRRKDEPVDVEIGGKKKDESRDPSYRGQDGGGKKEMREYFFHASYSCSGMAGWRMLSLLKSMVGGTGLEPVTPGL